MRRTLLLAIALDLGLCGVGGASPGAYTNASSFAVANPGGVATVDFDALAPGTPLSNTTQTPPNGAAGVILPAPVADVLDPGGPPLPVRVVVDAANNPASSGTRSLGVDDAGNFNALTAGTSLGFAFTAPVGAFGLTIITPEEPGAALFDGDLQLVVPGEATASLALGDGQLLGTFGGREYRAYFVGVVGASSFSTATLGAGGTTPVSSFFYNVDDLVVPLPEPGMASGLLVCAGLLRVLAIFEGKQRRERRKA